MSFFPVFGLMSYSLTAIEAEPNQCPLQSILLTQGPIPLNLAKKYWALTVSQNEVFLSRPFWIFFSKNFFFFFCLILWKVVKGSWIARMGRNFDDYPGFQPFRSWANTYAQDCTIIWWLFREILNFAQKCYYSEFWTIILSFGELTAKEFPFYGIMFTYADSAHFWVLPS